MLSGLMSRWTTPRSCARASALATWARWPAIGAERGAPPRFELAEVLALEELHGDVGQPSWVTPWSSICTTWGLFTCAAAAASREKRATASGVARVRRT